MGIKEKLGVIGYIIKVTFKYLLKHPKTLSPFVVIALFNILSLFTLYLAPLYPFKRILGPPIVRFWGVKFLHYPYNFILLPNLFFKVKNFLINPLISSVMIAVCAGMIYHYYLGQEPSFSRAFNKALRRYVHLLLVMGAMIALTYLIGRFISYVLNKIFSDWKNVGLLNFVVSFFITVGIEALFAYAFLIIMIKGKGILSALKESFVFSSGLFFITYILVLIPRLFDLAVGVLARKQLYFMDKFIPDVTLLIIITGILVAIFSDGLVYSFVSNLYILRKKAKDSSEKT